MGVSPLPEGSPQAVADGPGLEVVIVSSTGALELLRACLSSLREHPYTGGQTRVHVVDNASSDGTPEMVGGRVPRGDAARRSTGTRASASPTTSSCANRGALRPAPQPRHRDLSWLARPHDGADGEDTGIGIATCRLEKRDGSLDHAAKSNFPTPSGAVSHWLGLGHRFGGRFDQYHAPELGEHEVGEVERLSGAYMLTRKAAIDRSGCSTRATGSTWTTSTGATASGWPAGGSSMTAASPAST